MNIYPITPFNLNNQKQTKNNTNFAQQKTVSKPIETSYTIMPDYNKYLISFGAARVDKGLERFYEVNQDRMPETVKNYIETLEDKSKTTPIEAQQKAFEYLDMAQSIDDIKEVYPDEPLFKDLRNPQNSKAPTGIIHSIKENEELLSLSNQGVLKDKSNLTVYLVKKIFLENKTLEEINQDLDNDLDPDFKADFKFKNEEAQYIYTSTLDSLGIKRPKAEYRQSLRFTKEGYSDLAGEKITESLRRFWDSMPQEERTARAKKSVEKFEIWWNSHTKNEILDMIADQTTELDMLKSFKKAQRAEAKTDSTVSESGLITDKTVKKHTRVGSKTLSSDELFIKWATNNLKLYIENLSEAEKDTLHIKRMQRLTARWAQMTPTERTDYISKMKSGSEPLRYTMIDAWNHSTDIIKDLSSHLKANQIYKPSDLLYSTEEFSEFQSRVMTEFWANHPEHAETLGKNIVNSQEKINMAISRGTFEELKKAIMRDKNHRIKEFAKFKQQEGIKKTTGNNAQTAMPEYMRKFKEAYLNQNKDLLKNLPDNYIKDYFNVVESGFSQKHVEAWTKNLNREQLTDAEFDLLREISKTEPLEGQRINRTIEATLAKVLYECTGDPKVFRLSHSDLKVALSQVSRGEDHIEIDSLKLKERFKFPIKNRKIDKNKIAALYNAFREPLTPAEVENIAEDFFRSKTDTYGKLSEYLKTYGKSLNILFSDKSAYPIEVKKEMLHKLLANMPKEVFENYECAISLNGGFEKEAKIKQGMYMVQKEYDNIPDIFLNKYLRHWASYIRKDLPDSNIDELISLKGKATFVSKFKLPTDTKLRILAMETAMADTLYEVTGDSSSYGMELEDLSCAIKQLQKEKKFPYELHQVFSSIGLWYDDLGIEKETVMIAKRKPNVNRLKQKYLDYINEIVDWVNNEVKYAKHINVEDLLHILSPYEGMEQKDLRLLKRIDWLEIIKKNVIK